jgi:8-oxo-dGTP pyrophosphatase MutT (NUDIX family)
MTDYDRHEVSAKAALFSHDFEEVLVMEYLPAKKYTGYGLPGGHVDRQEHPDDAIRRELREELGLQDLTLERAGFYQHRTGKIILGYTAVLGSELYDQLPDSDAEIGIWKNKAEFAVLPIDAVYRELVERTWPVRES